MKGLAIRQIITFTLLLGTIGIAFNILFGENTMIYVGQELIGDTNISWWKIDINGYIQNLKTMITNTTELEFKLPTRNWQTNANTVDQWYRQLTNNLALILDYIILIINAIIYPMRLGGYLIRFFIAMLGLNTADNSSLHWLGVFVNNLVNIAIPYV